MTSPLIAIVGPTGAGNSVLGLALAEIFGGEIVGCDSIQVYRRLDIGSAKIPAGLQRGIPHHLLDVVDIGEELTAGAYSLLARDILKKIAARRHLPIVVGGTGLYLRALLEGLSPAPTRDPQLRSRLLLSAQNRPAVLHRFLRLYDPTAAARIHTHDRQKLIRAVELALLSRRPASETQAQPRNALEDFNVLKIGLAPERSALYAHLNARTSFMFTKGLLEETQSLLDEGVPLHSKALASLGYKQAVEYLNGNSSLNKAIQDCQTKTRQYAKRQMTWFRSDPSIHWLPGFGSDTAIQSAAIASISFAISR